MPAPETDSAPSKSEVTPSHLGNTAPHPMSYLGVKSLVDAVLKEHRLRLLGGVVLIGGALLFVVRQAIENAIDREVTQQLKVRDDVASAMMSGVQETGRWYLKNLAAADVQAQSTLRHAKEALETAEAAAEASKKSSQAAIKSPELTKLVRLALANEMQTLEDKLERVREPWEELRKACLTSRAELIGKWRIRRFGKDDKLESSWTALISVRDDGTIQASIQDYKKTETKHTVLLSLDAFAMLASSDEEGRLPPEIVGNIFRLGDRTPILVCVFRREPAYWVKDL